MAKPNKATINSIRQHSRQLVRELDVLRAEYSNTGCTFSQCHVLFELSAQPMGLMELAGKLLMDKSNTSRLVKKLVQEDFVITAQHAEDSRQKIFSLTKKGQSVLTDVVSIAEMQAGGAMSYLTPEQQQQAIEGLSLYASALKKHRLQNGYNIRRIRKKDNAQMAKVIRDVMTEFGAVGPGYSIVDPEVDNMYGNYQGSNQRYYVIEHDDQILGGGGISPLLGGDDKTCELRKMFFLPDLRGRGLGQRLLQQLMDDAREIGYCTCYLETLDRMHQALNLYLKFGFVELKKPLGNTGHCACDRWLKLELA